MYALLMPVLVGYELSFYLWLALFLPQPKSGYRHVTILPPPGHVRCWGGGRAYEVRGGMGPGSHCTDSQQKSIG